MTVVPGPIGPVPVGPGASGPGSTADRPSVTAVFGREDLSSIRALVNAAGTTADVEPDDLGRLVLAVTEIASNALLHGGGARSITLEQSPTGLRVEIRDHGPGLPDGLVISRPSPYAVGGRGLWLAHLLCADITVASSAHGVTVTMAIESRRRPPA